MTPPILRVLIQEELANGHSPHAHIPHIGGRPKTHPAMPSGLFRRLTLAAFAALGTIACAASAGAAEAITSCATLSTFGGTYVLAADLTGCGDCLVVTRNRITIDLAGYTISASASCQGVGAGVTDDGAALLGTTVKNGTVKGFGDGIVLANSARNQILNLTSSNNSGNGINVGVRSLVKDCAVVDNGENGILIGEFGQIQDCTITGHVAPEGNGGFGIVGAGHLLVKDNDVRGNKVGILVGDFGTVAFNNASGNAASGLFAGNHSLVTGNTTNGNGIGIVSSGITTGGLSSVSHNTSSGNGGGGINVVVFDPAIDDGTRNLVTGNTTNDNGLVGVTAMCPGTVTNNKSSGNGLNYDIGRGCRTGNNKE